MLSRGATPYRLEEEKMAVILQQVVGTLHGQRFYPDFSAASHWHNFYPVEPMTFSDGIAAVARDWPAPWWMGERASTFACAIPGLC